MKSEDLRKLYGSIPQPGWTIWEPVEEYPTEKMLNFMLHQVYDPGYDLMYEVEGCLGVHPFEPTASRSRAKWVIVWKRGRCAP